MFDPVVLIAVLGIVLGVGFGIVTIALMRYGRRR